MKIIWTSYENNVEIIWESYGFGSYEEMHDANAALHQPNAALYDPNATLHKHDPNATLHKPNAALPKRSPA